MEFNKTYVEVLVLSKVLSFFNKLFKITSNTDFLTRVYQRLNGDKVLVFFEKNIEEKHFYHHDKNYYYLCKSDIPVINLIIGSRNMIKIS